MISLQTGCCPSQPAAMPLRQKTEQVRRGVGIVIKANKIVTCSTALTNRIDRELDHADPNCCFYSLIICKLALRHYATLHMPICNNQVENSLPQENKKLRKGPFIRKNVQKFIAGQSIQNKPNLPEISSARLTMEKKKTIRSKK